MYPKNETFSSLDMSKGPLIVLGDDSFIDSLWKGRIDLDYVTCPNLQNNFMFLRNIILYFIVKVCN